MLVKFSWDCSAPKRKDSPVPGSSTTWASSLLLPGIIITLRLWSLLMSLCVFCWCRIWTCGLANLRALSCARGTCFSFCYFVRLSYSSHHLMIRVWLVDYIGLYCLGILFATYSHVKYSFHFAVTWHLFRGCHFSPHKFQGSASQASFSSNGKAIAWKWENGHVFTNVRVDGCK